MMMPHSVGGCEPIHRRRQPIDLRLSLIASPGCEQREWCPPGSAPAVAIGYLGVGGAPTGRPTCCRDARQVG